MYAFLPLPLQQELHLLEDSIQEIQAGFSLFYQQVSDAEALAELEENVRRLLQEEVRLSPMETRRALMQLPPQGKGRKDALLHLASLLTVLGAYAPSKEAGA